MLFPTEPSTLKDQSSRKLGLEKAPNILRSVVKLERLGVLLSLLEGEAILLEFLDIRVMEGL